MARPTLSPDRIVRSAVEVADDEGLDRLTIRTLATRMRVTPMAVYHHFAGKDAILDAAVDAVFAEIELPDPTGPWRAELRRRCRSARAVLARHPWAVPLLESRRQPGPATLTQHDAVLGVLLADGFPVAAAGHAFAMLDAFVLGFVVQEASLPFSPDDAPQVAADILASAAGNYPNLARFVAEAAGPGYDFGAGFDVLLEVVLDGCAALRAR